jgi:hypothetical protein
MERRRKMTNLFWIGVQEIQKSGGDVQSTAASAQEAVQVIEMFKSIASAIYMDVWWLTIATFSFVWAIRRILNFVEIDIKNMPRIFTVVKLKKGIWPAVRDFLWGCFAVAFASTISAAAKALAPECLPDLPWFVLGLIYGLGAVFLYLIMKRLKIVGRPTTAE